MLISSGTFYKQFAIIPLWSTCLRCFVLSLFLSLSLSLSLFDESKTGITEVFSLLLDSLIIIDNICFEQVVDQIYLSHCSSVTSNLFFCYWSTFWIRG